MIRKSLTLIILTLLVLTSCTKKEDYGSVYVTVLDVLGFSITDEQVYFFDSEEEMNKQLNTGNGHDVYNGPTDDNGEAYFPEVKVGKYWVLSGFDGIGGRVDLNGTVTVTSEEETELTLQPTLKKGL